MSKVIIAKRTYPAHGDSFEVVVDFENQVVWVVTSRLTARLTPESADYHRLLVGELSWPQRYAR